MAVPINAATLALYPQLAPTNPTWTSGYSEEGAAVRGLEPTTVPVEQRFEGGGWQESIGGVIQAAAPIYAAASVGPAGIAALAATQLQRNEAQEAAEANAADAAESRDQWVTGFQEFGRELAERQQTLGQAFQGLQATFGAVSQTFSRTTLPRAGTWATLPVRSPISTNWRAGIRRLPLTRRVLTVEDL